MKMTPFYFQLGKVGNLGKMDRISIYFANLAKVAKLKIEPPTNLAVFTCSRIRSLGSCLEPSLVTYIRKLVAKGDDNRHGARP